MQTKLCGACHEACLTAPLTPVLAFDGLIIAYITRKVIGILNSYLLFWWEEGGKISPLSPLPYCFCNGRMQNI